LSLSESTCAPLVLVCPSAMDSMDFVYKSEHLVPQVVVVGSNTNEGLFPVVVLARVRLGLVGLVY